VQSPSGQFVALGLQLAVKRGELRGKGCVEAREKVVYPVVVNAAMPPPRRRVLQKQLVGRLERATKGLCPRSGSLLQQRSQLGALGVELAIKRARSRLAPLHKRRHYVVVVVVDIVVWVHFGAVCGWWRGRAGGKGRQ
jgi:hypothetical protein